MNSLISLNNYFDKRTLKNLSITWIDKYFPSDSKDSLCQSFEKSFNESASLFGIDDNVKLIMESLMRKYYHNEAFIKAGLIKELRKHKAISFFELPIKDSRIDLCSINGHSVAYEIKTKYDNLKRLSKQVDDYLTAFEFVYVVCSNDKTEKILSMVPTCVGVYEYDDSKEKTDFILIREASLSANIKKEVQLSVLRKAETPSNIYEYSDSDVNELFKKCLKDRYKLKWESFCKNFKNISVLDYQYYFKNL